MDIRSILYAMYQIDWMHSHMITAERWLDVFRRYYVEIPEHERNNYTILDYLNDFGYDGELYACFEEFLECEYLDEAYIKHLCGNEDMFKQYLATRDI